MSLVLRGLSQGEPFFLATHRTRDGIVTWLIIGTVALLVILAAAPLFNARMPCGTGPFAKE
jgi:hypothetical protein